jgi:hypothetical protein
MRSCASALLRRLAERKRAAAAAGGVARLAATGTRRVLRVKA